MKDLYQGKQTFDKRMIKLDEKNLALSLPERFDRLPKPNSNAFGSLLMRLRFGII